MLSRRLWDRSVICSQAVQGDACQVYSGKALCLFLQVKITENHLQHLVDFTARFRRF
jgi:hypothetical protein